MFDTPKINTINEKSYEQYIDSILNNYKNLGNRPSISIISINRNEDDTILVYLMHSSIINQCYKKGKIKHVKNCKCDYINYEKYIINNKLEIYHSGKKNPEYISDIHSILLEIIKEYQLFY